MLVCNIVCAPGRMVVEFDNTFMCGPLTNFTWTHQTIDNPTGLLPGCTGINQVENNSIVTSFLHLLHALSITYRTCILLKNIVPTEMKVPLLVQPTLTTTITVDCSNKTQKQEVQNIISEELRRRGCTIDNNCYFDIDSVSNCGSSRRRSLGKLSIHIKLL